MEGRLFGLISIHYSRSLPIEIFTVPTNSPKTSQRLYICLVQNSCQLIHCTGSKIHYFRASRAANIIHSMQTPIRDLTSAHIHNRMKTLRKDEAIVPIIIVDKARTPFVGAPGALVEPALSDVDALELVADERPELVEDPG